MGRELAVAGRLIAFEGLDQSGKQTQAELLRDALKADGHKARLVSFPDYGTSIGEEIARALQGEREYGPDVMQLLYVANRYERDLALLARVRESYRRQAAAPDWLVIDGERSKDEIAADVLTAVRQRLAQR